MNLTQKILVSVAVLGVFLLTLNYVIDHKTDDEIKFMLRKSIERAFKNFKVKYAKTYKDDTEEQYRFSVFTNNYVEIYRHNKFLVFSKVGVNQFADLTHEEFKALYTGHKHSKDDDDDDNKNKQPHLPTDNLPASFDWRDKGAITPVKVQNGCGGCWAFSTVQSIEGLYFLKTGKLESLSTQQVIDCCRIDESGCLGGDPEPAFRCIQNNGGIMTETEYPYIAKQQSCKFDEDKPTFQIGGYIDVPSDQSQVKAALLIQPLSICLNSSDTSFKYYKSGVITECEDGPYDGPDHCLLLVGYGHDEELKVDYWLIKNQWGTTWGEEGYVRIIRDDNDHKGPGKCFVVAEVRYPIAKNTTASAF
ncbi:papain family cysteine protease (macronuclear) [Tetrahymena thermophila SB210]|uniref:Papain family cysteine protease n=1 Tax=Tetrahymena thermophila (strain SB210) TaxID=312017 RepID=I7LTG7_TETTS|nr:papain family cysteine protease [Tetrahymena thermophila SB210]EAR85212.1 papain family cysteine protease [Tetrahymena thermophila SB210]|eukprot:XP_001032875.1 papain family cysteine protease [Tetrahymena thermophila SB210]